ncbi:hypothetical protein DSM21852_39910 [Methylocystis bryophila]|nr:hypothetical protein DSM21852_39910 [Methylocystis bryophila]
MTPAQCRAARGLISWSQQQLADAAQVGIVTVRQFETEAAKPRNATLAVIRFALESAGVVFVDENGEGPGVRLRKSQMSKEPIYVDATRSAVLNDGVRSINCPTLGEAKAEFDRLTPERKEAATITSLGRTYTAEEIERFHDKRDLAS